MGTGKTTVGQYLHQRFHFPFIDTDKEIELREKKSIGDIFASQGEASFRGMERVLLRDLFVGKQRGAVIATGGGSILLEENRRVLRSLGFVVWLSCSAKEIYTRTRANEKRPLLATENPQRTIERLLEERKDFYAQTAHLTIDTKNLLLDEICVGILESARYHFSQI